MTALPDPRELLKGTTKGPWQFDPDTETRFFIYNAEDEEAGSGFGYENARLIAAAPDIAERLAVCEEILRHAYFCPADCEHGDMTEKARSALSTGGREG